MLRALRIRLALLFAFSVIFGAASAKSYAQEKPVEDDKAMAAYADAANFQTGGAIDLAIEAWQKFIDTYPKDPKVSKAAHYLGVCYMQQDPPDYVKAISAYDKAVADKDYELREESLANLGWCLYAKASASDQEEPNAMRRVVKTFQTLQKENKESRFLDRVYFYSGEAEYSLGNAKQAVKYYDQLLAMPKASESALRCDALYARGVAQEDLDQVDAAIASFKQLLASCKDEDLAADVHLRLGDLRIMRREFGQAIKSFQQAFDQTDSKEDQAYALFRQAFAHVQDNQPGKAAALYETLASKYPKSPYAASANLAAAQSLYRAGKLDQAAERFEEVAKDSKNKESSTEASHWLARIAIGKNDYKKATAIAQRQVKRGLDGDYANELQLDLAEALAMNPKTVGQSLDLFEKVYRENPKDELAPRALYNAAFSALQMGQSERALKLSNEFNNKFQNHPLSSDVNFVLAEGNLAAGRTKEAVAAYRSLVQSAKPDDPQRPVYVLRLGAASNAAKQFDNTIKWMKQEIGSLKNPDQKSEAFLLVANAQQSLSRGREAAAAFNQAASANPDGPRAKEARLLQGQSLLLADDVPGARKVWDKIIAAEPKSRMAMQAEYKLAELDGSEGKHQAAMKRYQRILAVKSDQGLIPYAKFGLGFSNLQQNKFDEATKLLTSFLNEFPEHPLANEALLTRGICYRNQENAKSARPDLDAFLATKPTGDSLGHALYESALVDGIEGKPSQAVGRLNRIVKEVPSYPAMDKVLYELAWALQDSGQADQAVQQFSTLIRKYPKTDMAAEASYFVGQKLYAKKQWKEAAAQFEQGAADSADPAIQEKSLYRMGWSLFKLGDHEQSEQAFAKLANQFSSSSLAFDAKMMVGENRFKKGDFKASLAAYEEARQEIRAKKQSAKNVKDKSEQQVRELVLLHGGQSAAQMKKFKDAIDWYDELRSRFPSSRYLPQVFYETGFAHQQNGDSQRALKFFGEVAENYRNEIAARARFMMGEIHFAERKLDQAIPEYQRVMFGFGAEQAPEKIKNWQAKSGFEAGRCSELLQQTAKTPAAKAKAAKIARNFYQYVVEKHSQHELAIKAKERLDAMQK